MAKANAVAYAEQELGVHEVYETLKSNRDKLDKLLTDLSKARDDRREKEHTLAEYEALVASNERGKHVEMSQSALDKHIRQALFADANWLKLRQQIRELTGDVEGLEYDIQIVETDIRIGIARVNELGGYLNYLAAAKTASILRRLNRGETGETT